ncbi:MAG: methionine synthase [Proteobacteria bacterium]|nr:methionine synthase [Pseudomonadota bacterium]
MKHSAQNLFNSLPVILDGAWGTQMQARGLPVGKCGEGWNLDDAGKVEEVARAYVSEGSEVILTNTFCGNRIMLERHGLADRTVEINRAGAEISKRAAGDNAHVFGSMGPTGKMIMTGDVTEEELENVFTEQAAALAAGGADGIVIETMAALDEYQCAIRAAKSTGLLVAACMVYDSGAELDRTMMGTTPEQQAEAATEAGADIVGANCGLGIKDYIPIAARFKAACDLPVWIKPNAGLPEMVDGKPVYKMTAEIFAEQTKLLTEAGAGFVGGCCGTSPEFIRAVKKQIA